MAILNKINIYRRKLMRAITRNVGQSHAIHFDKSKPLNVKRILISRPNNRLGNLLLVTPLIQEVIATFPNCKIDLFVRGSIAPILFQNYPNVDRIVALPKKPFKELLRYVSVWTSIRKHRYDIAINVDRNSSSGRLSTMFSNADFKIFGPGDEDIEWKYEDQMHMAKFPVYTFRDYLVQLGLTVANRPIPTVNLKLSAAEIAHGQKLLQKIADTSRKTIAIFTYATGAKRYPENWWSDFYKRLCSEFPDYNVIEVLPIENVSQIGFTAPSFYSKDVREIAALIANTRLFIGSDSGIMHLATASQATVLGLFSVTDPNRYAPYGNGSLGIDTNNTNLDQCLKTIHNILESAPA